jgi:predicted acylesterase/phospholipase RssA
METIKMYILVLPISGGGFVSQLAILQHLCEINFIPDVTLASSGGNVAAYVAAAANWKWAGIERVASQLNQGLFVQPWNSNAALSVMIGYFKSNIYNKGSGIHDFLKQYFTPESIVEHEIWTGTYNKNRQQARLFCNRKRGQTVMDASCIDHDLTQSMTPVFADGNIDVIGNASLASASIPAFVPPQRILGEDYIDGGVASASPLTIMQEPILKRTRGGSMHMIYVNSVDLSRPVNKPIHNVIDNWRQATSDLVRSQTVIDRLSGYEILRCYPGEMHKNEFVCNHENMKRLEQIQQTVRHSLLEIYPIQNYEINIGNFNGQDVVKAIREAYVNCRCRLWWLVTDDNQHSVVNNIMSLMSS